MFIIRSLQTFLHIWIHYSLKMAKCKEENAEKEPASQPASIFHWDATLLRRKSYRRCPLPAFPFLPHCLTPSDAAPAIICGRSEEMCRNYRRLQIYSALILRLSVALFTLWWYHNSGISGAPNLYCGAIGV